jgi:hypothetical protein
LWQIQGYIATDLKFEGDGCYRVRDFWNGHREFEGFRDRRARDFAEFDRQVIDGLVEKQEFVGAYYEADGTLPGNA